MYEFIMWLCLTTTPACPVYESANHNMVIIMKAENKQACEDMWKQANTIPNPEGMKSYHKCQPVTDDI